MDLEGKAGAISARVQEEDLRVEIAVGEEGSGRDVHRLLGDGREGGGRRRVEDQLSRGRAVEAGGYDVRRRNPGEPNWARRVVRGAGDERGRGTRVEEVDLLRLGRESEKRGIGRPCR
jgi:hypothetical protein